MLSIDSITKEQFHRYMRVQLEGKVNMQDRHLVALLSVMNQDTVEAIQHHYEELLTKYGESA